jgi:hypothetical protein
MTFMQIQRRDLHDRRMNLVYGIMLLAMIVFIVLVLSVSL